MSRSVHLHLHLQDEVLGGAHRVLPRRTSLVVNAASPPCLVFLPGQTFYLDLTGAPEIGPVKWAKCKSSTENTTPGASFFVMSFWRLGRTPDALSNRPLSLPLSVSYHLGQSRLSGLLDTLHSSACLISKRAPGRTKMAP